MAIRTFEELLGDHAGRIARLERRLPRGGGGGGSGGGGTTPYDAKAGIIVPFAGGTVPSGWLLCDGTAHPRAGYPQLFAAIGTTYGAGDGTNTFNVPNLKGRVLVGRDPADALFDVLGEVGGAKTHTLTPDEMPAHSHAIKADISPYPGGVSQSFHLGGNAPSHPTGFGSQSSGAGAAHNNLQPYQVTNYIISTGTTVGGGGSSVPALPNPWAGFWNATVTLTGAAGTWENMVPGAELTYTVTLATPLWVDIEMSGYLVGTGSTYGMFGVEASGALTLAGEHDQASGNTAAFGYTAFAEVSPGRTTSVHKSLLLPVGTTTLRMKKRRSNTSGTPSVGYPTMIVTPRAWAGAPGPVQSMTRGTTAQRDAVYGVPASDAAKAALANQLPIWFNTDKGWNEVYYATTGIVGLTAKGLLANHASGWYPAAGSDLYARRGKSNGYQVIAQNGNVDPVLATMDINRGGFADNAGSGITVPIGGRYQVHGSMYYTGGTNGGTNTHWCRLFNDGQLQHDNLMVRTMTGDLILQTTGIMTVLTGKAIALVANTQSASVNVYGTNGFQTWIEVIYLGPPLVNG